MSKSTGAEPIIRTKLYRPPVPADFVERAKLGMDLDQAFKLPLTVLSSPAGYGKSILISHWLQHSSIPHAWLSLDESDSDIRVFINYFVAALRTVSAEACGETLKFVTAESLPPLPVLVGVLSNDLDELDQRMVLVLDDYQRIRESEVHTLLDTLLAHPPRLLHLVILSRRDPQLSLASFRAGGLCYEMRMRDLEFSYEETALYFRKAIGQPVDHDIIDKLHEITEGWVVGVRLASLAFRDQDDIKRFLDEFGANTRPLREYLVIEVLSKLPPGIRDCLLSTSILDRFNAPLCEAVCSRNDSEGVNSGKVFVDLVHKSGLFCIALDGQQNWFRFHHLFGDLLRQQLCENRTADEIKQLHNKASAWLADNGWYQEAIQHALAAGEVDDAVHIVGYARHELMNMDLWYQLELWLKLFSHETEEQYPQLLVLRCWLDMSYWYQIDELVRDVEKANALLKSTAVDSRESAELSMELSVMRSALAYWMVNSDVAGKLSEKALEAIPTHQEYVRSVALMYRAGAYQLAGQVHQAELLQRHCLDNGQCSSPGSRARNLQVLCFIYWADADSRKLLQAASMLLEVSLGHEMLWSESFARYFLGVANYECNELSSAIEHLRIVVDRPYNYPIQNVMHCSFLLSQCYQATGLSEQACDIARSATRIAVERGNRMFIDLAEAFQAGLDLKQGHNARVDHWLGNFKVPAAHVMHRLFNAELTYARAMIGRNQKAASEQLDVLQELMERSCHRRLMIDVLAMKALVAEAEEDTDTAAALLQKAVNIGLPGMLIRPLADLGSDIVNLLDKLELDSEGRRYVDLILSAATEADALVMDTAGLPSISEALSRRELQILNLFARNLSNKEIAHQLCISTGTVKRHAHNIYGKLDVSDRHKAVAKAASLGMLASD